MEKQTIANKKWQEKNREHTRYLRNRSTTRSFLKKQATLEDIEELLEIAKTRKEELSK
jgi:conserved domain protein|nr:MAG TPA: Nitroreductase family [Caudoviricetes sp.]DAT75273.1 MAG TPA: Nitroreductase family [Caudoviricetes sp.]